MFTRLLVRNSGNAKFLVVGIAFIVFIQHFVHDRSKIEEVIQYANSSTIRENAVRKRDMEWRSHLTEVIKTAQLPERRFTKAPETDDETLLGLGKHQGIQFNLNKCDHESIRKLSQLFHEREELVYNSFDSGALNTTVQKTPDPILFFNRVNKSGSRSLRHLLCAISFKNNFQCVEPAISTRQFMRQLPEMWQKLRSLHVVLGHKKATFYSGHVYFLDFEKQGLPVPIYISMVRDPIERVISNFYFIRQAHPFYNLKLSKNKDTRKKFLEKDFSTCVLSGDPECLWMAGDDDEHMDDLSQQSIFFCGHEKNCGNFSGDYPIEKAKENVEKYYAVVGVLEHIDETLRVLEHYIPRFFRGAFESYYVIQRRYENKKKPSNVTSHVKNILRENFTKEIEFYDFCKQRLLRQYNALPLRLRN